ncbi:phosphonate ABC transporter ATP-binding protein [Pseudonocardia kunmingensis]|uniref:Phosphonate transport system ATP-binding protein n=1 Tax=Pseudonocardia kunmingensis TaxID=630975 RepID=A0A543DXK6_9PSEU|nr:ATP-binding cassette domain-containing protein [Pseudonocardia kunmingensis]TQM14063.1 phosphonate transport system ATP-binding protein [Pseudonocardia kunmingensis]
MTAKIVTTGLALRYRNGHEALRGVDLVVGPGELVALVGSNGAGKSSLLRCLVRLQEPTGGSVVVNGVNVRKAGARQLRRLRQDVGVVSQRFNLVERIGAFHNVVHGAIGREGSRCLVPALCTTALRAEAMECLDRVGLADLARRRVDTLSGGQRQRVAIARALMQKPWLVLADEPVASLDPSAGRDVMELLRSIAVERELTVVAALHQVDFALTYTQRIVGMQAGKVVLDRPTPGCTVEQLSAVYGADPGRLEAVN